MTSKAPSPALDGDALHRLLLESVADYAIFMLDPQGYVRSWNTGAQRIKGWTADEIIGEHFSRFYPSTGGDDRPDRPDWELDVALRDGRFEDEGWRKRKDGTLFWANIVITPMRDPSGTLVGFAKVTRDLTERLRHQEELRISEERFRILVDSVQDYAIFMLDLEGRIVTWNAGAQRMKGYRADEIIGQHFSRFYPQEALDRGWPEHELVVALEQGRFEDEGWRLRKDGTMFWANVVITTLRDRGGKAWGFSKVTRDLTERRKVEALEEAGRQTNEFLAMLGHELRNPLAPIRNAVELMRAFTIDEPRIARARDIIDRQTTHLTRLVDDLLDVGRITTGKVVLHREPLDLAKVMGNAIEVVRPVLTAKHQHLAVRLSEQPVMVDGDPTRLSQIAMNLLNNAAKYTPDGGHLRVEVELAGKWAQLRVADDGVGMSTALVPRVFELFVQGERSLDRSDGGLGVGLTVVRKLVELHGGSVSAASQGPGTGSTFLVRLPLRAAQPAEVVRTGPAPAPAGARHRVLVVDDNEDSAETVGDLISIWGHEVRTVYDGPAALAAAQEFHPDVVLMDIGLPQMSGYEVAERMRAMPAIGAPMLVAMTGYGQDDDLRRAREAGFAVHMVKPVTAERLRALLTDLPARR